MKKQLTAAVLTAALGASFGLKAGFDDVGLGARPLGMGSAFVALADDNNAIYWNPAGMVLVDRMQAQFMHGLYGDVSGVNFDYLSFVMPMNDMALGLAWSQTGATLEQGDPDNATSSRMSEDMYYLALGYNPSFIGKDMLSVGASVKRLNISSDIESGGGVGFDAGALFRPFPWIQAGVSMRNLAASVRDENLDPTLRFGLASRLFTDRLRLAVDMSTANGVGDGTGTTYKWHAGAEVQPWQLIALRIGSDNGNLAAGAGLSLYSFSLDYGFSRSELVGNLHRVSLGVSFGPEGKAFVQSEAKVAEKAAAIKPPAQPRGGFLDGNITLFWDASASPDIIGYNVYMLVNGAWTKINDVTIEAEKRAATLPAAKGETYELAVTAVRVDKVESVRSESLKLLAR